MKRYSTKKAQLQEFVQRLNRMVKDGSFYRLQQEKRQMLIHRVERLKRQLGLSINLPSLKLKHTLAAATLVAGLGFSSAAQAQSFDPPVSDPFGLSGIPFISQPDFADLDGDGDQDLLVGSYDGNFVYYENTGDAQSPQFSIPQKNPFNLDSLGSFTAPTLADMDADGDLDLMVGSSTYNSATYYDEGDLYYFENTGSKTNPQFSIPTQNPFNINPPNTYVMLPTLADLDWDGDMDLMVGDFIGGIGPSFLYFENTGTASNPSFQAGVKNPFNLQKVPDAILMGPSLGDIDGDGDLDLLAAEFYYGELYIYENKSTNNSPDFGAPTRNPWDLEPIDSVYYTIATFVDIDDDGDLDVFQTGMDYSTYYSTILYYENTSGIVGIQEPADMSFNLQPNPATSVTTLQLEAEKPLGSVQLEVLNALGQVVQHESVQVNSLKWNHQVNVQNLEQGIYTVRLRWQDQQMTRKVMVQ